MSRVLLGWELGSNLGHLSRLLPLGRRLRARGHTVLAVVRDLALASQILAPAGIPFIQAPVVLAVRKGSVQPASYADILRYAGWADLQQLWAMTQAWVNVLRMFNPDIAILDHSPTALLAIRCAGLRSALLGTGFELPPLQEPLPCFPGFPGATRENADRAEAQVLENANRIMQAAKGPALVALKDLFQCEHRWLTTFAELDHYGARLSERYVGPIGELGSAAGAEWPSVGRHRVFAYVRPDTPALGVILRSLGSADSSVVCYGPGVPSEQIKPLLGPRFSFSSEPLDLQALFETVNLCVSYAPSGTVTSALLQGVPQLMAPAHVEAQLTAHRVECMGAGLTLRGEPAEQRVSAALQTLLNASLFKTRAAAFADRYSKFNRERSADELVEEIHAVL